jgi:hypothetical protein
MATTAGTREPSFLKQEFCIMLSRDGLLEQCSSIRSMRDPFLCIAGSLGPTFQAGFWKPW